MNKDTTDRKRFVKNCIDNPEKSAVGLISLINSLYSSGNTAERVKVVSELLHISPSTVWRDYMQDEQNISSQSDS